MGYFPAGRCVRYKPAMTQDKTASAQLSSMTGFARKEGGVEGVSWVWEARSVNGKSLDLRCHLPAGFERLEAAARAELAKRLRAATSPQPDRSAAARRRRSCASTARSLDQLIALVREVNGDSAPVQVDGLLGVRGVVENGDCRLGRAEQRRRRPRPARRSRRCSTSCWRRGWRRAGACATSWPARSTRSNELSARPRRLRRAPSRRRSRRGSRQLGPAARGPCRPWPRTGWRRKWRCWSAARRARGAGPARRPCRARRAACSPKGGGVGRRLDFLCQEFNREANTLCSKAADVALTRIGLDLKAVIEQFREQVQNIE